MNLNESTRKYILFGIVLFIVISVFSAKLLAKKQDTDFAKDDVLYQQATQLASQGSYAEAATFSSELLLRQPNSEDVNYISGMIAANTENYQQAAILLQKTMDINPHKIEDAMFMIQFAEVLFFAERYEDAKVILEKCREWGWAPEDYPTYQERVNELLAQIESMK
jgi:predicted Zn-dependent protease